MTTPRLTWSERPRHLRCQGAGCGREPLCGFLSEDGATFFGACCYSDCNAAGFPSTPRFLTPKERAAILDNNR